MLLFFVWWPGLFYASDLFIAWKWGYWRLAFPRSYSIALRVLLLHFFSPYSFLQGLIFRLKLLRSSKEDRGRPSLDLLSLLSFELSSQQAIYKSLLRKGHFILNEIRWDWVGFRQVQFYLFHEDHKVWVRESNGDIDLLEL
jgi:hypothetical protein